MSPASRIVREYVDLWLPQLLLRYPGLTANLPAGITVEVKCPSGDCFRYLVPATGIREVSLVGYVVRLSEHDLLALLRGEVLPSSMCRAGRIQIERAGVALSLDAQADYVTLQRIFPLFDGRLLSSTQKPWVWGGQDSLKDVRIFEVGNDDLGFFATMTWTLELLWWCRQQGLRPYFVFRGQCYRGSDSSENWFESFFFHKRFSDRESDKINAMLHAGSFIAVPDLLSLVPQPRNRSWSFSSAHEVFFESIGIRENVLCQVEKFVAHNLGLNTLGVHYRGTDKTGTNASREAERLEYGAVFSMIDRLLADGRLKGIFVATDESNFRIALQDRYRTKVPVVYNSALISESGGVPIHFDSRMDPYARGFEALLDSLILSRCDLVLKTPSYLSGWSKIFRPGVEVLLAEKPNADACWFPDALLELYPTS